MCYKPKSLRELATKKIAQNFINGTLLSDSDIRFDEETSNNIFEIIFEDKIERIDRVTPLPLEIIEQLTTVCGATKMKVRGAVCFMEDVIQIAQRTYHLEQLEIDLLSGQHDRCPRNVRLQDVIGSLLSNSSRWTMRQLTFKYPLMGITVAELWGRDAKYMLPNLEALIIPNANYQNLIANEIKHFETLKYLDISIDRMQLQPFEFSGFTELRNLEILKMHNVQSADAGTLLAFANLNKLHTLDASFTFNLHDPGLFMVELSAIAHEGMRALKFVNASRRAMSASHVKTFLDEIPSIEKIVCFGAGPLPKQSPEYASKVLHTGSLDACCETLLQLVKSRAPGCWHSVIDHMRKWITTEENVLKCRPCVLEVLDLDLDTSKSPLPFICCLLFKMEQLVPMTHAEKKFCIPKLFKHVFNANHWHGDGSRWQFEKAFFYCLLDFMMSDAAKVAEHDYLDWKSICRMLIDDYFYFRACPEVDHEMLKVFKICATFKKELSRHGIRLIQVVSTGREDFAMPALMSLSKRYESGEHEVSAEEENSLFDCLIKQVNWRTDDFERNKMILLLECIFKLQKQKKTLEVVRRRIFTELLCDIGKDTTWTTEICQVFLENIYQRSDNDNRRLFEGFYLIKSFLKKNMKTLVLESNHFGCIGDKKYHSKSVVYKKAIKDWKIGQGLV